MAPPNDNFTPRATRESTDLAGVGHRTGEPVEFGDDQGVADADGRESLVETWPGAASAGEAVVEVDPVFGDSEATQRMSLGSQVLLVGGAASVADEGCGHTGSVR
jgi:hypothetical protein